VLEREHPLLVATLRLAASGQISVGEDGVYLNAQRLSAPLRLAADNTLV